MPNNTNMTVNHNPMKTNTTTATNIILRLLLVTATLMLVTHSAWAGDQVPFKGKVKGAAVSMAPDPAGVVLTLQASGRATHLGQCFREEVVLFNPVTGTLNGTMVFTAANGDQLFATVAGGFTSPTTAIGTYSFTGGTGRFSNSSGSADFVVTTPDGINFVAEFDGKISSVGSNKK
jgi:hypothetical protein